MSDFKYNEPFHRHNTVLTSPFGFRGREFHDGTDWAPIKNHDRLLRAVSSGWCLNAGWHPVSGNFIWYRADFIDGRFYDVLYAHLAHPAPKKAGDRINIGEWLGVMGTTGSSTGVHVHVAIKDQNGRYRDPELWLENVRLISENRR